MQAAKQSNLYILELNNKDFSAPWGTNYVKITKYIFGITSFFSCQYQYICDKLVLPSISAHPNLLVGLELASCQCKKPLLYKSFS